MDTIKLFRKLVSIPSAFPQEKQISSFLGEYLKKIGFTVEKVQTETKGRNNLVATFGKAKTYLAFYGHMDTVPPDRSVSNPYSVVMKKKQAWGLGTEDMKGAIAAILQTGEYAVLHNLPMKIIFCVDEENISQGAHDVIHSGLVNDISILIAAESGQVQDMTKPFSALLGRKGRILFELTVFGKRAHAAESQNGVNAIEQAVEMITLIKQLKFPKHPLLGTTDIVFHSINSQTDSFSIPDIGKVQFSLLTTPYISSDEFRKKILNIASKNNISITLLPVKRKTPYGESYATSKAHLFVKKLISQIFLPSKVKPFYTPSVADENIFANRLKIPVVSVGPIGSGGHTKDEWVDINSVLKVEEVYKQILRLYHKRSDYFE